MIITIGRQYGSGGRRLAQMLSKHYNIPLYDKDLINRVSEETGIAGEFFSKVDEKPTDSFFSMILNSFSYGSSCSCSDSMLSGNSLFCMQSEVIRKIAEEGDCIFVGRCADYILRDNADVLSIFVEIMLITCELSFVISSTRFIDVFKPSTELLTLSTLALISLSVSFSSAT